VKVDAPPASSNVSILQAALDGRYSDASAFSSEPSPRAPASVSTAAGHSAGVTSPLLLGVKAGALPASSNVPLLQASLDACAPRGKGKAPPSALPGGLCDLLLKNTAPGSHLESTYCEENFGAHEYVAFIAREILFELIHMCVNLSRFRAVVADRDGHFFGSPLGPRQGAPHQCSEHGST
jgi:hypothetical protein